MMKMKTLIILILSSNICLLFLLFGSINLLRTPWNINYNYTNFTLTLFFLFSFFFFISLNHCLVPGGFAWSFKTHHEIKNSPTTPKLRGPIGWFVLGNLPEMAGSLAHRKLANLAAYFKATRLMPFSLGSTRVIISSHPETAKEILGGSSFSDRPIKDSARLLMFERAIGFAPNGTYWRQLRRIAAVHMFSPRRISGLEVIRRRVIDEMLMSVSAEMEKRGTVGLKGIFQKGSLTNVLESVFSSRLGIETEVELGHMVKEGYDLISRFNWEDYFPVRFLDFYGLKRKCHVLAAKVNTVVGQIVEERKIEGNFGRGNDFLSALLSLPVEEQLSDSDMVAVLWVKTLSLSIFIYSFKNYYKILL